MISDELRIILVFLGSFFGTIFVLPKLAHIAERIGLTDQPNRRKVHRVPRPLVGGIGMVIAFTFSSLLFVPMAGLRGFFAGLSVLLLIGFLDDFREIGHKQKFIAQILATSSMIYFSKVSLSGFGDLLNIGSLDIPGGIAVVWLVTVFCVVGVVNSVNLIDGLDGLAGGLSFNAFIFFAIHASLGGNYILMLLNISFAGAVLGFLRFNWHPATLFMGDAGSLCLGFSLAFMALALTQGENNVAQPVVALLILAVPITDTVIVMLKRIIRGTNPFIADKYHLHHIFMRIGMGKSGAVRVIISLSFLLGCLSLLQPTYNVPEYCFFIVFMVYFLIYLIASFYIIWMLRYSFRFRKLRPKSGAATPILKAFFNGFDTHGAFRKSQRYDACLKLTCRDPKKDSILSGKVLDISNTGCMANINQLKHLEDQLFLSISFPFHDGKVAIELPAEHVWTSEHDGKHFHGFKFNENSTKLERIIKRFVATSKKKSL